MSLDKKLSFYLIQINYKMKLQTLIIALFIAIGVNTQVNAATSYEHAAQQMTVIQSGAKQTKLEVKKEKAQVWLANKIYKKMKKQAKKKGIEAPQADFADIVTFAGAIVCVVGIISIIGNVVGGLIVAGIGLLIYFLGAANGGSIGNLF